MDEKIIIKLQSLFRGYQIRKYILIPSNIYQTKNWRLNQKWYKGGKMNECEKYQISLIEKITKVKWKKTDERINLETNKIETINKIYNIENGFDYTENFDGKIILKNITIYFNLKFICDRGGSQTRSLREVYHFIKSQLKIKNNSIYFINIIDGNTFNDYSIQFKYLKNKIINKQVFIGDLSEFQKYYYFFKEK